MDADLDETGSGDITWQSILWFGDSGEIMHAAMNRVWQLEMRVEPAEAITALREALEAVGPGVDATAARLALGRELLLRQNDDDDLYGAMWTVGRLLLADSGTDYAWRPAMELMGVLDTRGLGEAACDWWCALESAYWSHDRPRWDALDSLAVDRSDSARDPR